MAGSSQRIELLLSERSRPYLWVEAGQACHKAISRMAQWQKAELRERTGGPIYNCRRSRRYQRQQQPGSVINPTFDGFITARRTHIVEPRPHLARKIDE